MLPLPAACTSPSAQVLFGIGPDLSFDDLKGRRAYFVLDLLSPWAALAAATSCTRSGTVPAPPIESPAPLRVSALPDSLLLSKTPATVANDNPCTSACVQASLLAAILCRRRCW